MLKKLEVLPVWQQICLIIIGFLIASTPIVAPIVVIAQQYDITQPINSFPFNYWLLNFMEILGFIIVTIVVRTIEHALNPPTQHISFFKMLRKGQYLVLVGGFTLVVVGSIFNGTFMGISLPMLIVVLGVLMLIPLLGDLGYIEVKRTTKPPKS